MKVNISQLPIVDEVTVCNDGKTLHLLFSFIHWEFRSGSGHRHQVCSC